MNKCVLKFVYTGWSGDKDEHKTNSSKNTGVKKCQILCAVRDVPENVHNINVLLDLLQVEKLPVSFLFDLKVMALACGISSAGARHPCPYCTAYKDTNGLWVPGKLRTLEDIEEDHKKWLESGGNEKD